MFSNGNDRQLFLDEAEPVDDAVWREHVDAFIQGFVVHIKRDRWRHLCLVKPEKGKSQAFRMYGDLIDTHRKRIGFSSEKSLIESKAKGVYYDFSGQAWWLSAADALHVGHGYESIFSIQEGELCVYFWHEMEEYLCQKPKNAA